MVTYIKYKMFFRHLAVTKGVFFLYKRNFESVILLENY